MKTLTITLLFFICFIQVNTLKASHLMGCDIAYTNVGPDSFKVRLSLYRDCSGIGLGTTASIRVASATCGSSINLTVNRLAGYPIEVVQLCSSLSTTCVGGTAPGVQEHIYEGYIKLPSRCTDWVFSYTSCCRNTAITTLTSPGTQSFYIETKLNNLLAPTNSSPSFTTLPVPFVCLNVPYIYNHGIVELNGDSTFYSLVPCNTTNSSLSVPYIAPRSMLSPISTSGGFVLNSLDGDISFTPTTIEVGVFSVIVSEFRAGVLIGTTQRDMEIRVLNCNNTQPILDPISNLYGATSTSPYDLEICVGDSMFFNICGVDTSGTDTVSMMSNFNTLGSSANYIAPMPSSSTICGDFSWIPSITDTGYHTFTVKIADNSCPMTSSMTHTYSIRVVVCDGIRVAGPDNIIICQGDNDSVSLCAYGSNSYYYWNVVSGDTASLPCDTCNNFNVLPHYTTVYSVSDSTTSDTITVVVNPVSSTIINQNICDGYSYMFYGAIFTSSGTYYDTLNSTSGCDSIITLNLTVNPTSNSTINTSMCDGDSYLFNGNSYYLTGTYSDTFINSFGCDSIITLNLTVNPTDSIIEYISILPGDTLYIDTLMITSAGAYYTHYTNIYGCDSVMVYMVDDTTLSVVVLRVGNVLTAAQDRVDYQWIECTSPVTPIIGATNRSYTVTKNGTYAVVLSIGSLEATSACIDITDVGINNLASLKDQISVYPNPTNGIINIEYASSYEYEILSIMGQRIDKQKVGIGKRQADISTLSDGVYLLKIIIDGNEIVYRILKN